MSGAQRLASSSAAWPVAASPTTMKFGLVSISARIPRRSASWSSTMRMRFIGPVTTNRVVIVRSRLDLPRPRSLSSGPLVLTDEKRTGRKQVENATSDPRQPNSLQNRGCPEIRTYPNTPTEYSSAICKWRRSGRGAGCSACRRPCCYRRFALCLRRWWITSRVVCSGILASGGGRPVPAANPDGKGRQIIASPLCA